MASGEWRVASGEWRGKRRGIAHYADFVRNDGFFCGVRELDIWDFADMGRGAAAHIRGGTLAHIIHEG